MKPPLHPAADLIALDIGGAQIKAADGRGWTRVSPFPMWLKWEKLRSKIASFLSHRPNKIVATMTGEIADCFSSRKSGVAHIVNSLCDAADKALIGIYTSDGELVSPEKAKHNYHTVAAANWHAVARLAASLTSKEDAVLLDIGSTTVDVIPIRNGQPIPLAFDDASRLATGELVYTGIERTPVSAILKEIIHRGVHRPVSSELFARSQDAWILLKALPEQNHSYDTADGKSATASAARLRLARTMLLDSEIFSMNDAYLAAEQIADAQSKMIMAGLQKVMLKSRLKPNTIVVSGHGKRLAQQVINNLPMDISTIYLQDFFSNVVSRSAPAHALALIARGVLS